MIRRFWPEWLGPYLLLILASILVGVALGCSIRANAEPLSAGEVFAQDHAADVCIALDAAPTMPGLIQVFTSIENVGLSSYEAGVAVATSVGYICPHHRLLLQRFVDAYSSPARSGVTA